MSDRQAEKIARLLARAVDAEIEVKRAHDENRLLRAQKKRIANDLIEMTGSRDYWYARFKNAVTGEHVHNWVTRKFDGTRKDTEFCTSCGLEFYAEPRRSPSDRDRLIAGLRHDGYTGEIPEPS